MGNQKNVKSIEEKENVPKFDNLPDKPAYKKWQKNVKNTIVSQMADKTIEPQNYSSDFDSDSSVKNDEKKKNWNKKPVETLLNKYDNQTLALVCDKSIGPKVNSTRSASLSNLMMKNSVENSPAKLNDSLSKIDS